MDFPTFAASPYSEKVYLVELDAALASDPAVSKTFTLATSARAFEKYYFPVVARGGVPALTRSMQEVFRGQSMPSWGALRLTRQDGRKISPDGVAIDQIISGAWLIAGRNARILFGGEKLPYSEFRPIFVGKSKRMAGADRKGMTVEVIDRQNVLSKKIITPNTVQAGANVPEASVGMVKRLALGPCSGVTPILIDQANYVYLTHDNAVVPCQGIPAAYVNGKAAAFTDLGNGTFQLSVAPDGLVTCDVLGAKFGGVYAETVADISAGLLQAFGEFSQADIDATYVAACNADFPHVVHHYADTTEDILRALDELTVGLPIYYTFTREGVFRIGEFTAPGPDDEPDFSLTEKQISEDTLTVDGEESAIWRQLIGYGRNHTPITEDRADPSLSLTRRNELATEYRVAEYSDSAIKSLFPLAEENGPVNTALISKAAAQAVAEKWVRLMGCVRRTLNFETKNFSLAYELGKLIRLTYPRFGLGAGKLCRITRLEEDFSGSVMGMSVFG